MKRIYITITFLAISLMAIGQHTHQDFFQYSNKNNNQGMAILGTWAVANLAIGAVGWSKTSGPDKYFHQMNFFWNTVNLGIVGFSLISNAQADPLTITGVEIMRNHKTIENLYLINGGLDILYMGTGLLLRQRSLSSVKRPDLLKGYGNSIMLQGGFLFVFDGIMWVVQRNLRLDFLNDLTLSASQYGAGLKVIWGF